MTDDTQKGKLRFEFYQTDTAVVVSVFIRNTKQESLKCDIEPRSVALTVTLPTGAEAVFDLDPLARSVDPATSFAKALSSKIEITLKKAQAGIKWNSLEGDEEGQSQAQIMS